MSADPADGASVATAPRRRQLALVEWGQAHPLIVVAVVASAVAVGHGIWLWRHRHLGALDPDEAGYVGAAMHYHQVLTSDPLALPRAIGGTGFGPMVPVLSVPLLLVGPDDVRTVMLMQPVLSVVAALAVAGIAGRLAGAGAAVVAGTVFVTLPTVVFASQTYWFGLGAATFLALGVWALLASERLTNRWAWAFGACIGAMVLSRTMALGFLPAAAVAAAVVAGRDRRAWVGVGKAALAAILVAGPWYLVARESIFSYLFSYGYGERAGLFGDGGPVARIEGRFDAMAFAVGAADVIALPVVVASIALAGRARDGWPPSTRSAIAVGAAVLAGFAALATTTNNGVWFELPVLALAVPLVVALGARAPAPFKVVGLAAVLIVGAQQLASAWWVVPPEATWVVAVDPTHRVAQYEYGFAEYDPRFAPDRRDELVAASAEWWEVNRDVAAALHEIAGDDQDSVIFTQSGNFQLFNTNSVVLAALQDGWLPRTRVPDTVGDAADRAADLEPTVRGDDGDPLEEDGTAVERVLVIARHDQHLFTPDAQVEDLYQEALESGWQVTETFRLPLDGVVSILRHEDGSSAGP